MFCKLALGNVRRSFRDYGVYLLTLTFGVCLFYTFNSLEGQPVMGLLQSTRHSMVESIFMLLQVFSVFVAVVLACLVVYGNSFLLRRRKRELGTYLLLGMGVDTLSASPRFVPGMKHMIRRLDAQTCMDMAHSVLMSTDVTASQRMLRERLQESLGSELAFHTTSIMTNS